MEDFNELFSMFSSLYESLTQKKLEYDDFVYIFSRLKLVREHVPVEGFELILLIDELLNFKEKRLLGLINAETLQLVRKIYFGQNLFGNVKVLSPSDIIKHLLLPYQINTCKKEQETYVHISGFEFMFSFLAILVDKANTRQQDILRKYNKELYELLLHYFLCVEKVEKKKDTLVGSAIINMFSVFYFKQNEYDNDYSFLDEIVNNVVENKDEFIEYCNEEGIKEIYLFPADFQNTYAGIIKYMDESYKIKRKK